MSNSKDIGSPAKEAGGESDETLLPCPFGCKAKDVFVRQCTDTTEFFVECRGGVNNHVAATGYYIVKSDAIDAWNTRQALNSKEGDCE